MEDSTSTSHQKLRHRIRVLLIIYFFSEDYSDTQNSSYVGLLKSEVKIQKIDFLIRYPSYLCYELILLAKDTNENERDFIKTVVRNVIQSEEPQLRTIEMKRFLYGAWDHLDKTILFLKAHGLIDFKSKVGSDMRILEKGYFLTQLGKDQVENGLSDLPTLKWYQQRCLLIKKYFGDLSGTELKALQYRYDKYKDALINEYITDIEKETIELFFQEFKEAI